MWCGGDLYGLGVQGVRVLFLFGVFFCLCGSSISARLLIYGAHAVCFLPLVAILDLPVLS
jgi:hypothetical protein